MFRKLLKSLSADKLQKPLVDREPFPSRKPFERSMTDPLNPRNPFGWVHPASPNNPANQRRRDPLNPSNPLNRQRRSPFSPSNPMNPNSPFNAGRKRRP